MCVCVCERQKKRAKGGGDETTIIHYGEDQEDRAMVSRCLEHQPTTHIMQVFHMQSDDFCYYFYCYSQIAAEVRVRGVVYVSLRDEGGGGGSYITK